MEGKINRGKIEERERERERKGRGGGELSVQLMYSSENFNKTGSRRPGRGIL